jgi:hypothetical protein
LISSFSLSTLYFIINYYYHFHDSYLLEKIIMLSQTLLLSFLYLPSQMWLEKHLPILTRLPLISWHMVLLVKHISFAHLVFYVIRPLHNFFLLELPSLLSITDFVLL